MEIRKEWVEGLERYAKQAYNTFDRDDHDDIKILINHKLSELFGYIKSIKYYDKS